MSEQASDRGQGNERTWWLNGCTRFAATDLLNARKAGQPSLRNDGRKTEVSLDQVDAQTALDVGIEMRSSAGSI